MEKKVSKVKQYKQVENGEKEVISFIASDGREFIGRSAEKECETWEKEIEWSTKFSKIQTNDYSDIEIFDVSEVWYLPKDEEELEMVKSVIGYNDTYNDVYVNGVRKRESIKLQVGKWVSGYYIDGGDCRGIQKIYTKDFIVERINDFLKSFPQ